MEQGDPMLGSPLMPHKSLGSPSYNSHSRTRRTTSTMRFHFSIYCCNGSENTKDILWSSKFRGNRRTETLGLGWPQRSWHSKHQALLNAESSFSKIMGKLRNGQTGILNTNIWCLLPHKSALKCRF